MKMRSIYTIALILLIALCTVAKVCTVGNMDLCKYDLTGNNYRLDKEGYIITCKHKYTLIGVKDKYKCVVLDKENDKWVFRRYDPVDDCSKVDAIIYSSDTKRRLETLAKSYKNSGYEVAILKSNKQKGICNG